jgi:propionyl-CoA synthetase
VAECAVIGVRDPIKGHIPVGIVVLKDGSAQSREQVTQSIVAMVLMLVLLQSLSLSISA